LRKGTVVIIAVLLGAVSWLVGLLVGSGPTPIAGGAGYLLVLAGAGCVVAVVEGELGWTGLAGLYAGQLIAFGLQAALSHGELTGEPIGWQPFFILSFMLAAVLGGLVGAVLGDAWRSRQADASS
jgi:hypothetical protein